MVFESISKKIHDKKLILGKKFENFIFLKIIFLMNFFFDFEPGFLGLNEHAGNKMIDIEKAINSLRLVVLKMLHHRRLLLCRRLFVKELHGSSQTTFGDQVRITLLRGARQDVEELFKGGLVGQTVQEFFKRDGFVIINIEHFKILFNALGERSIACGGQHKLEHASQLANGKLLITFLITIIENAHHLRQRLHHFRIRSPPNFFWLHEQNLNQIWGLSMLLNTSKNWL